jgi:hypothetical protein
MNEPPWKTFLNWGAVILFFSMPIIVMVVQLFALAYPAFFSETFPQTEFNHLKEYQRILGVLVLGLAGFKSWEVVKANGHHEKK